MKIDSRSILIILILMLFSGFVLGQNSTNPSVTITPQYAVLQPGGGVQFDAQLFTAAGEAVKDVDEFTWRVKPDSLAGINEDGFLQAGREPGLVVVVASIKRGDVIYYGEAKVEIGKPAAPPVKVIVSPQKALVQPDSTIKFNVVAVSPENRNFPIEHIRWTVQPNELGRIAQNGLFTAGPRVGQGTVTAYLDIGGAVYRGEAEVTIAYPPSGSISGEVTKEMNGEKLKGAQITVARLGELRWFKTSVTDENGVYKIDNLIPGLYVVKANARDYLAEYYDDAEYLAEALPLQVDLETEMTGIDFQLGHGGTIKGKILTDDSTTVLPGTLITAIRKTTDSKRFAIADTNGEYCLRSLPQGAWVVLASSTGYYPEYFDDATDIVNAELLNVTPPDTTSGIDFYLATTTAIRGNVFSEDGNPLAGALVTVFQKSSTNSRPRAARSVLTDAKGHYIVSVPAGVYVVHASARGFNSEYFDDQENPEDATDVVVIENQHTTDIDFKLAQLGGAGGKVVDQLTQKPLAGAVVYAFMEQESPNTPLTSASGRRYFKTSSDSVGVYKFEALPNGKYFIEARATGYLSEFWQEAANLADAKAVSIELGEYSGGIDFTLSSGAMISGKVADAQDSTGLAGASVTVWSSLSGVKKLVYCDREGFYKLSGLPAGEYFAFANQKGYDGKFYDGVDDPAEATLIKLADDGVAENINFYLPEFVTQLGTISGVVTEEPDSISDTDGIPIAGGFVIAIPTVAGPAHFDVTDPFGNYRITRLLPGNYIIFAWAPGHTGEFFDNVQNWREAKRIIIDANAAVEDINFALAETEQGPYAIRGRIHTGEGQQRRQLANAIVFAKNDRGMAAAVTDEDGRFTINGLPAGDYKLIVEGSGILSTYYGGTSETDAQSLTLDNGVVLDIGEMAVQSTTTAIGNYENVPAVFSLQQNYPNPFNPETTVKFSIARTGHTVVQVFNILGQYVNTLMDAELEAGSHSLQWNATDNFGRSVASGLYVLQLTTSEKSATIRMVLLR
ncbi:carboxypeptidase regulatory-like domain-containing protein [candidate division KSB1 bacterium]|nr:carboxypeptidase regulatory-like domain-containing protein [candidate division KSB1 bacterium]